MEFAELVMRRRTVRRFEDAPVDRAVLEEISGEFHPIGVIPVGRPLPDVRSASLKRGWLSFEDFTHQERW